MDKPDTSAEAVGRLVEQLKHGEPQDRCVVRRQAAATLSALVKERDAITRNFEKLRAQRDAYGVAEEKARDEIHGLRVTLAALRAALAPQSPVQNGGAPMPDRITWIREYRNSTGCRIGHAMAEYDRRYGASTTAPDAQKGGAE